MKLNQANTNTHHANHNIHTHKRTLRTLQIGHSRQQQQITAMSRVKKATQQKVMEKRRHRHLAALSAAESFLVYGHLNEITHSVWFRALSR